MEDMIRKRPIKPYWITLWRCKVLHQVLANGWWYIFFLVSKMSSFIAKQSTHLRNPRSVEDCHIVTLQYHGYWRKVLKCLQFSIQIQQCTISNIIPATCKVIYKSMKDKFLNVSKLLFILLIYFQYSFNYWCTVVRRVI